MTILGRHTVAETKALISAIDFRFQRTGEAFKTIPESYKTANPDKYAKLQSNWAKAKDDWTKALEDIRTKLKAIVAITAGSSEDIVPSEEQYAKALSHTSQGGRNGEDSEYMTRKSIETITGKPVDFTGQPSQLDIYDVDHGAYKKVDTVIKDGEKKATDAVKSSTVLYVGLGAAAALGLVVAAKVYL